MKVLKPVFLFCFFLVASSCAYVEPFVRDFNLISVPEEVQIGKAAQAQIQKTMPVSSDAAATARVRQIGERLVNALPSRDFPYQFYVVDDPSPNAFTIPGGTIYAHTGLLKMATDAELAGVLAHELGHAYDRHPVKNMSRAYGAEYLDQLLFPENKSKLKSTIAQFAANGFLLRYSRDDEFSADEIGYHLLSRAGMSVSGLLSFFRKLQSLEKGGAPPVFLSTHPPTPERIARLEQLARQPSGTTQFR